MTSVCPAPYTPAPQATVLGPPGFLLLSPPQQHPQALETASSQLCLLSSTCAKHLAPSWAKGEKDKSFPAVPILLTSQDLGAFQIWAQVLRAPRRPRGALATAALARGLQSPFSASLDFSSSGEGTTPGTLGEL